MFGAGVESRVSVTTELRSHGGWYSTKANLNVSGLLMIPGEGNIGFKIFPWRVSIEPNDTKNSRVAFYQIYFKSRNVRECVFTHVNCGWLGASS